MSKRNYNVFLHLHTVTGITITLLLFIIFFAGTITLFFYPLDSWEKGEKTTISKEVSNTPNVNEITNYLEKNELINTGDNILFGEIVNGTIEIKIHPDSSKKKKRIKINLSENHLNHTVLNKEKDHSVAALLYDLHFFYQLGRPGYYFAGIVSFMFLIALITGLIVHWKKIRLNFFVFRPNGKAKVLWTDLHTALGVIGFPFQFMYALTGAMFGLGIIVALFAASNYNNSIEQLYEDIFPRYTAEASSSRKKINTDYNFYIDRTFQTYNDFHYHEFEIYNFHAANETFKVHGEVDPKQHFQSEVDVVFNTSNDSIVYLSDPNSRGVENKIWSTVYRLHFGFFGELPTAQYYAVKSLYFLLGIASCIVILSGALIWIEARKNGNHKFSLKYYERTTRFIFSFSFGLVIATFAAFCISLILNSTNLTTTPFVYNSLFFPMWFIISLALLFVKTVKKQWSITALISGVICWILPLLHMIVFKLSISQIIDTNNTNAIVSYILFVLIGSAFLFSYKRLKTTSSISSVNW